MKNRFQRFRVILFLSSFLIPLFLFMPFTAALDGRDSPFLDEKYVNFRMMTLREKTEYLEGLSASEKKALFDMLSEEEKNSLSKGSEALELTGPPEKGVPTLPEGSTKPDENEGQEKLSNVETILSGKFPTGIFRDLRQYGYDFFEANVPAFTPLNNVAVGSDYIIGPGDEIKVFMWGRIDATLSLSVENEGTINLPEIGVLSVAGLTFGELKGLIKRKVEAITGVNANVSMGRLRTIDVFVVGEAKHPATYSVSSLSTVITALYSSGGPSKNGSLRGIRVLRNGEVVVTIDLYDFFIKGRKENDIRLQTGDTIFIPVLGPVAGIAGAVRRPAIYEMNGVKTIGELIELSGGILPTSELQNVVVERIEGHQQRVIKSFNLDPSSAATDRNLTMPLKDFDVVKIYPVHERVRKVVYLEGHVKYPREYELKRGMRLRDIIPAYDFLLPEPYLPQAEIVRLTPPDLHPELIQFNLGALMSGDEGENFILKDEDRIIIYDAREKEDVPEVTIEGSARNPGRYRLYKGMTVRDLIFQAGNLTSNAYLEKATLSRVVPGAKDTDIQELEFSPKKAMEGLLPDDMVLHKDDSVRIREIPLYSQALGQKIFLEGALVFPGAYTFSDGDRLSSVIEKAGGLSEHAYALGAAFYRESVKKVQEQRLKDYISQLEEDILTMSSQEASTTLDLNKDQAAILAQTLSSRKQLVEKLKGVQVTGRMVINLPEILANPLSSANLELRSGDRLVIDKRPDNVNVMGEVYNPTAVFAEENKTVDYYLNKVGGVTPSGDKKQIYVVKTTGAVISKTQESFFGMTNWDSGKRRWTMGFGSIILDPGDTIVVPKEVEKYPWMRTTKDITQILYQIAVGAGVIVAAY